MEPLISGAEASTSGAYQLAHEQDTKKVTQGGGGGKKTEKGVYRKPKKKKNMRTRTRMRSR